jgi:hypothetical protein
MKFKALQTKREPKEFVIIDIMANTMIMYTCNLPHTQPLTATMEGLREYYAKYEALPDQFDLDDLELVEFEMYEIRDSSTVGADIRNKLTPSYNLLSLLKLYFKEEKEDLKGKLKKLIEKEIPKCEETIKYISNLLE